MTTPRAILAVGVLLAGAVLFSSRWQIGVAPGQVYRLDRWTGAVVACNLRYDGDSNTSMFVAGNDVPCTR